MATPVGQLWAKHGHHVFFGSRSPEKLESIVLASDGGIQAGSPEEAAEFGEVVLEAIPFGAAPHLPVAELQHKILLSASNYFPFRDGEIDLNGLTQTAWLAQQLPGVRMVKTFSMMGAAVLNQHAEGNTNDDYAMFIAGDDEEANRIASQLVADATFVPVQFGAMSESWMFESLTGPLFNARMNKEETLAAIERLKKEKEG